LKNTKTIEASNGEQAFEVLSSEKIDVTLCDIKMPKLDGIELLEKVAEEGIDTQFIMISAHGNIDTAVEATKLGAFDFIQKPPDLNRLLIAVRNAIEHGSLKQQTKVLKKRYKGKVISLVILLRSRNYTRQLIKLLQLTLVY